MNKQEQARFNMVEQQIRPWQVLDTQVLDVLAKVPREVFVPHAYQALAYTDMEVPLGHGQHMLPPRVAARLVHDLQLKGQEKVLEIGTGSGYMTALLSGLAQRVVSLELNPELAQTAQRNLQNAGVLHADVRVADALVDLSDEGHFDAIVLNGSVAEVPQALLNQLKVGARLIAIVGDEVLMNATLFTRTAADAWQSQALWETAAPRLQGFAEPSRFTF